MQRSPMRRIEIAPSEVAEDVDVELEDEAETLESEGERACEGHRTGEETYASWDARRARAQEADGRDGPRATRPSPWHRPTVTAEPRRRSMCRRSISRQRHRRTQLPKSRRRPRQGRPAETADGADPDAPPKRKRSRRGSRGGKKRRKPAANGRSPGRDVMRTSLLRTPAVPWKLPRTTSRPSMFRCPSGSTTSRHARAVSRYHAAAPRALRPPGNLCCGQSCGSGPDRTFDMTYAIIKVAGKQYRVREGERLLVDRLHRTRARRSRRPCCSSAATARRSSSPVTAW